MSLTPDEIAPRLAAMRTQITLSGSLLHVFYQPTEQRPFKVRSKDRVYGCQRNFTKIERLESYVNKITHYQIRALAKRSGVKYF